MPVLVIAMSGCDPANSYQVWSGSLGDSNPTARQEYLKMLLGDSAYADDRLRAMRIVKKQIRARQNDQHKDAGIQEWEALGPEDRGGRVRAIAVDPADPNHILAGGVSGGIWESNNGGASWHEATATNYAYAVTSIVFDPENSNNVYASTGEINAGTTHVGVGILKSTNNGGTWSVISVDNRAWLSKVIVNPLNTDILYTAASSPGRVYRSDDAGANWAQVSPPLTDPLILDLEIHPIDTSILYMGTDSQVMRSSNSGVNFTSMMGNFPLITTTVPNNTPCPRRCELSICQGDPDVVYVLRSLNEGPASCGTPTAYHSELWHTEDGGITWARDTITTGGSESTSILGRQGWYDNTIWADPVDCSRAVFGGLNIWKWEDNTLTMISDADHDIGGPGGMQNSIHVDQHVIVPAADYGVSNPKVYIGNDGGVYSSDDIWNATTTNGWATHVPDLNITQIVGLDASLTGDTMYAGSQDNNYFVNTSVNSGSQNWDAFSRGDGGHGAVNKSNPAVIYASNQRGIFTKSSDGGNTFCEFLNLSGGDNGNAPNCGSFNNNGGTSDNPLFYAPFEIDPNDDQTIYAGASTLWKNTNAGASGSWTTFSPSATNTISSIEIADGDPNTIWVGYTGGLLYSTSNGGTNWVRRDVASMPNSLVTDIAINPNDHSEVMVTYGGGYGFNRTWFTDDGGTSWSNRSLPFSMRVFSTVWHPEVSSWVYIGTDIGIFASEDKGITWNITPLTSNAQIMNWDNDGPIFTAITELVWQGNGSHDYPYYLVAGTYGRGIWRTAFPIRGQYYVDKNCSPCGQGSFAMPYATLREAVEAAGNGAEIIFLSGGTYDEVPNGILVQRRIRISIAAGVGTPVVVE